MKNVKEIIILSAVLALFFAFAITKVSFAFVEASKEEKIETGRETILIMAAEAYAKYKSDEFTSSETFLYGSDLIEAGFLIDIEDMDYGSAKIKVVSEEDGYHAEVVE